MPVYTVQAFIPVEEGGDPVWGFPVIRHLPGDWEGVRFGRLYTRWDSYGAARRFQRRYGCWQQQHPLAGFASFHWEPPGWCSRRGSYVHGTWRIRPLASQVRFRLLWGTRADPDGEDFEPGEGFPPLRCYSDIG